MEISEIGDFGGGLDSLKESGQTTNLPQEEVSEITKNIIDTEKGVNRDELMTVLKTALEKKDDTTNAILQSISTMLEAFSSNQAAMVNIEREKASINKRRFGFRTVSAEEIPVEDMLQNPVIFFSFGICTLVADDFRRGVKYRPPYNKPFFFQNLRRTPDPKKPGNFIAVCYCRVYSKKEAEWLRTHSRFNVSHFEDLGAVENTDAQYMAAVMLAQNRLENMDFPIVIRECKNRGIDITNSSPDIITSLLRKALVGEIIASENSYAARSQKSVSLIEAK